MKILIVVLTLALMACSTTEGPEKGVKVVASLDTREGKVERFYDNVSILDSDIQRSAYAFWGMRGQGKLSIENVGSRPTPAGNLESWITIRNRTDKNHVIEIRTAYLDELGNPLDDVTQWTRIHLSAGMVETHRSYSIKPADDFNIEIRRSR